MVRINSGKADSQEVTLTAVKLVVTFVQIRLLPMPRFTAPPRNISATDRGPSICP